MLVSPVGQALKLKRPSATPPARATASFGSTEDQSGMKKALLAVLMSGQSAALPGPSKVETKGRVPSCLK
jgi:hypothetical protein